MRYSTEPKDHIFLKGYGSLSFTRNMCKSTVKNESSKYSQNLIGHAKQSAKYALKIVSERATGDLIGNRIPDKITKVSKTSPQDS